MNDRRKKAGHVKGAVGAIGFAILLTIILGGGLILIMVGGVFLASVFT